MTAENDLLKHVGMLSWNSNNRRPRPNVVARSRDDVIAYQHAQWGRTTPDIADVQNMLIPVLRHRIIPSFNAEADGISRDNILENILETST